MSRTYSSFESRLEGLEASYGSAFEENESGSAIALTANTTFYPWITGAAGIITPGTDYVSWDGTNKGLLIGPKGAGIYLVSLHFAGTMGAANELRAQIWKNSTGQSHLRIDQDVLTLSKYQSGTIVGLLSLVPTDLVTVQFGSGTNSMTFTVKHIALSMVRINA